MSRRIIFCVLAAAATLIATQASADRKCENSCRLPEVAEAPAQAAPPPKAKEAAMPGTIRAERWPAAAYGASQSPIPAAAVVIVAPGAIYPDVGVVPAYPYRQHDPAWKLCQGDHRDRGHRYDECSPYSYHPYGTYGYRPNGTYKGYRSAPAYVSAPNAKIIRVNPAD
jgi:hypothetical protein